MAAAGRRPQRPAMAYTLPVGQGPRAGEDAAARAGRSLGRFVRRAHDAALDAQPEAGQYARRAAKIARETVDAARPEAERLAREALEASRPAAERAAQYVREHEDEIRQAGSLAGEAIVWRALPGPLRPLLGGAVRRFLRGKPPSKRP